MFLNAPWWFFCSLDWGLLVWTHSFVVQLPYHTKARRRVSFESEITKQVLVGWLVSFFMNEWPVFFFYWPCITLYHESTPWSILLTLILHWQPHTDQPFCRNFRLVRKRLRHPSFCWKNWVGITAQHCIHAVARGATVRSVFWVVMLLTTHILLTGLTL